MNTHMHMHRQGCDEGAHTHTSPDSAEQIYSSPLPAASRSKPAAKQDNPKPGSTCPVPKPACLSA